MKKYLQIIVLTIFISCDNNTDSYLRKKIGIEECSKYFLVKDDLYRDKEANLYLKSENHEDESGVIKDVWIEEVYGDNWEENEMLKDLVDIESFHFIEYDTNDYSNLYEDKNHRYRLKFMADGGFINLDE
jgi:hypothetical protein